MTPTLLGVATLVAVAAITPGPNNLVVMRAAALDGFHAAIPAMTGVVAGGLAMLALAVGGAGLAVAREPRLLNVVAIAGAAYLGWLGVGLIWARRADPPVERGNVTHCDSGVDDEYSSRDGSVANINAPCAIGKGDTCAHATVSQYARHRENQQPLPMGCLAMFGLQFLNPKTWVMVLTVTSAIQGVPGGVGAAVYAMLAAIFVIVPALCLSLWSMAGASAGTLLAQPHARRCFDVAMGLLLITSASLLFSSTATQGLP